ncbi:tRNA-splicing ligase RtcB [Candidatus Magnetominusculus xianensis]|uniref:3'-phosphate/5'-hydroxy nucleic acid ligase n=1 Tax=Candidatus Magnetominusculus xianensis TaxID=1748249 RepID=A0ABR5SFI8_9BACT|nr:tRNA-splicing ligase RtcB [Candidatus Magnetominusculus xianensis]
MKDLVGVLYNSVPSGVGTKGALALSLDDERELLKKGARWAVERGFGTADDLDKTESGGCIEGADPAAVSGKALERGKNQQGTLGSGNHFLEIQYVSEIFDEAAANAFGLFKGQITVMIHTGSRGLGHQVCTDYLSTMEKAAKKYGIKLYDKELAAAPFNSPEAQQYFSAMKGAANYAWANRQVIMHQTMEAFSRALGASPRELGLRLVYDVAHNIAKVEHHTVGGTKRALVVHRKGATRAFAKGHAELPESYRHIGQPVLIPGDMGRASYVLTGTQKAMAETFGSTCHGAGRLMSRHKAIKAAKGRAIWRELEDQGVTVMTAGRTTLAEEMPEAYKDVSNVVEIVHSAGISKKVAMLKPLGVVKG